MAKTIRLSLKFEIMAQNLIQNEKTPVAQH